MILKKGVVKMIDAEEVINKIKDDKYYTYEELTVVLNYIDKLKEEKEKNVKAKKYILKKQSQQYKYALSKIECEELLKILGDDTNE